MQPHIYFFLYIRQYFLCNYYYVILTSTYGSIAVVRRIANAREASRCVYAVSASDAQIAGGALVHIFTFCTVTCESFNTNALEASLCVRACCVGMAVIRVVLAFVCNHEISQFIAIATNICRRKQNKLVYVL